MPATIAIVGRPNVGKSTLFNRLVGKKSALTDPQPGVTRDRREGIVDFGTNSFGIIDTAGLEATPQSELENNMQNQTISAIASAHLVLLVIDGRSGLMPLDEHFNELVRKSNKPALVVVNKSEGRAGDSTQLEAFSLGLGEPIAVSAMHGTATGDLLDAIQNRLPRVEYRMETDLRPRLAIVGRPNVGKSSLVNVLLGETRSLVHDAPGTTRDSVDTLLEWEGQEVWIVDTAGIRRRGHIDPGVEQHSVLRAVRSIQHADIGIVVVDAFEGPTAQDAHVAGFVLDAGKGVVILANKWDLVVGKEFSDRVDHHLRRIFHFLPESPVAKISALTGRHVDHVLPMALEVHRARHVQVLTSRLNVFLRSWIGRRDPPSRRGRIARFKYATQSGVAPPQFTLFFSNPESIHRSYRRYLENGLRDEYGFNGTPVEVKLRAS